tara:strand:+ start:2697 stop:3287 length:591 start_codon:yes stop_codon:yes gene_type:complete
MVDNYNALINAPENTGKKRKISEVTSTQNDILSKTLKEQVYILTKVQDNLLDFIRKKLDVTEEEISSIRDIGAVNLVPVKRNPREIPGIFTDDDKRKYYINIHGAFVYKRPCGKPRKEKMWCHALGEWVEPGTEVSEEVANKMAPEPEEPDNDESPDVTESSEQSLGSLYQETSHKVTRVGDDFDDSSSISSDEED